MYEWNAVYCAAPPCYLIGADNVLWFPVPAFHQHIRFAGKNQLERSVFIEWYHQAYRLQRSKYSHTVTFIVDGPVIPLALALYRGIGIDANDQRCTQAASLGKISDVATVQNVKAAISEYQGALQTGSTLYKIITGTNLLLEAHCLDQTELV